jgi:hypothetical protein
MEYAKVNFKSLVNQQIMLAKRVKDLVKNTDKEKCGEVTNNGKKRFKRFCK